MNSKVIAGFAVATALAVPVSGVTATAASAEPAAQETSTLSANAHPTATAQQAVKGKKAKKASKGQSTRKAQHSVAQLESPYRKKTVKYSQWYAKKYMAARYGWGKGQQKAIINLWNKESGWNHKSSNGGSGAYGIPQSLPGSKMRTAGKDWRTNPETQIRWGLSYIKGRYGSPNNAWAHFRSHNWY